MENISSCSIIFSRNDRFPSDVLKWMKANAKPLMALKLMQVCKYFKHKHCPYFVISVFEGSDNNNGIIWQYSKFKEDQICEAMNLDIFNDKSLWITEFLNIRCTVGFSSVISKLALCQAKQLYFQNQNLTFDELKFLTCCNTVEYATYNSCTITDKDGENVALEDILNCFSNAIYLSFDAIFPSIVSAEAAANVSVPNLQMFEGYSVTENFNFNTFIEFMKTHPTIQCRITYDSGQLLSPEYKQQLENYIDKLIVENSLKYPPPVIHFPEQKPQNTLDNLHQRYQSRKLQIRLS